MVSVCSLSPAEGIGVRVGLFFMYTRPQAIFELGAFLGYVVATEPVQEAVLVLYCDTSLFQNTRSVMLSNA